MVSMATRRWGINVLHRDAQDRVTEVKILDIEQLHVRKDELSTLKRVGRSRAGGARISQLPHRKNRVMEGVYSRVNRQSPGRELNGNASVASYGKRPRSRRTWD